MFSALFHILAIWTAVSLSIGIVWITLCFAGDGVAYVKCSRSRVWRNEGWLQRAIRAVSFRERNPLAPTHRLMHARIQK